MGKRKLTIEWKPVDDSKMQAAWEQYLAWDPDLKDRPVHIWSAGYANGRTSRNEDVAELLAILTDLEDGDPCWHDHHGYCQAHFWLTDGVCPQKRIQDALCRAAIAAPSGGVGGEGE